MLGVSLKMIFFIFIVSILLTFLGLPKVITFVLSVNPKFFDYFTSREVSAASTISTLTGISAIWFATTFGAVILVIFVSINNTPPFWLALFTKRKMLRLEFNDKINIWQRFFVTWYWYSVDKKLVRLGIVTTNNRDFLLDYKSFNYQSQLLIPFVDLIDAFTKPLWLVNKIPCARPVFCQNFIGAIEFLKLINPINPVEVTNQDAILLIFLFCNTNGLVLTNKVLKKVFNLKINNYLGLSTDDFYLSNLYSNGSLINPLDSDLGLILTDIRTYMNNARVAEFEIFLTTLDINANTLDKLGLIDQGFFKI